MIDKPKASNSLGLEITNESLRLAGLVYKNKKAIVDTVFSIPLDQEHSGDNHVKPLYMEDQEKLLKTLVKNRLLVTVLETKKLLVRHLSLQLKKERDIDAVLEFQSEPLLPFPIEDAFVDKLILEITPENSKLTILACKKEQISEHLEKGHSLEIEPEVISAIPVALAAFSENFFKSQNSFIHLHIGATETTGILLYNKKLSGAQSLKNGFNEWIEHLKRDLKCSDSEALKQIKLLDFSNLSEIQYPETCKYLTSLRFEITKLVYALRKQALGERSDDILVTGDVALLKGASQTIFKGFSYNPVTLDFSGHPIQEEKIIEYAVPIGAALTGLPGITNQINFRQKEFFYPNPWKRIKKTLVAYIAATLLLSTSLYFFGSSYILDKEDDLKKKYIDLLTLMRKPFNEYEQEIQSKNLAISKSAPMDLTGQDIDTRLSLLDKEIKETPDMFPLYPNIPKVSDFLAWLSNTPLVTGEGGEKGGSPRIVLESLSYKMVKKPELNRKMDKYQVKVEMEFSTPTPRYAREFHDFLLKPNALIDPQGEVKWNAERGKYRASFFLKDKTIYPNFR